MIDIKKFIDARKQLKLSQVTLSDGICTQATLSKLENHQQIPAFDIMVALCERLGITLNDIFPIKISKRQNEDLLCHAVTSLGYQNLSDFDKYMYNLDGQLLGIFEVGKYQIMQYFAAVIWRKDDRQAKRLIKQIDIGSLSLAQQYAFYAVTLHYYYHLGRLDAAQEIFEDLKKYKQMILSGKYSIFHAITMYLLSQYQLLVKNYRYAMTLAAEAIDQAAKNNSTYFLDNLFWLMIEANDTWESQSFVVNEMIKNARVIAKMHGNEEILNKIEQRQGVK
ncbi:helix-turn-helix domain-containing protein [Leuconostoc rapi]|uniref:helix-turn-helix domain-containing protein n=1 Tax=Leuconostoc rapi TaxID=1406906 RepID=UPI0019585D12|nr:helix-turn-helix transcriptional regulator [Leuconostoc rapi]MBM7435248.1 DNA-binding XRE family transcriptional regulator [Leuconostoc rapi]